jgi:alpha-1,3-glucosyltransferase
VHSRRFFSAHRRSSRARVVFNLASPSTMLTRARTLAAVTALKLALATPAAYRSTDYEVHRNWLAVTAGLPLSEWCVLVGVFLSCFPSRFFSFFSFFFSTLPLRYTDATSPWTLDYPPLFAWFQRCLAAVAARLAPDALTLSADPVDSPAILAFQRGSVMAADAALAAAAWLATTPLADPASRALTFALLVASPGLLLVDHIHFQYNGWLCGWLVAAVAVSAAAGGCAGGGKARFLALTSAGAAAYTALVCSKHLFAAVGPVFAAYFALLALRPPGGGGFGVKAATAAAVALPVASVLALTFAPFYLAGGPAALAAIARRLAPLDRGLVHAYWAPNAWALAAGVDAAGAAVAKRAVRSAALARLPRPLAAMLARTAAAAADGAGAFSAGLVKVTRFACFPTPGPGVAAAAALVAQLPAVAALAAAPSAPAAAGLLLPAVEFAGLAAAAWGYHVHEKAALPYVLLAGLALGVAAASGSRVGGWWAVPPPPPGSPVATLAADPAHYGTLALASYHALLPLLFRPQEWALRTALVGAHAVVALAIVPAVFPPATQQQRGNGLLARRAHALAALLAATELYASILHPLVFKDRLPFLPLAATSLACAVGLVGEWALAAAAWVRQAAAGSGSGGGKVGGGRRRRAPVKK